MSSLNIKRLEVGEMKANCYLVSNDLTEELLIIDPGEDTEFIQNNITDIGYTPIAVLLTHGHFDHILRAEELRMAYNLPVYIERNDNFLIENMISSANRFSYAGPALKLSSYLEYEKELDFLDNRIEVINTPGHTPGSVSLYFVKEDFVFVGDLVFEGGGIGRYDFSYSDKDILFKSINKIMKLPDETRVFSGHGKPTTIDSLKYYFN